MTSKISEYKALTLKLLTLRQEHGAGSALEDQLLEQLDRVWLTMTPSEVDEVDRYGRFVAARAGEPPPPRTPALGSGVFTFAEAGSLTRLRPGRIREWFGARDGNGLFVSDFDEIEGDKAISFYDLIDVLVAGYLRESGLSLQMLRKVYRRMEERSGPHPFCRNELLTDGKRVFLREVDEQDREHLLDVMDRQQAFPKVILPYLRQIRYDEVTKLANRWNIDEGIFLDPRIAFGKPVVSSRALPTHVLSMAFHANGARDDLVSDWYGVSSVDVRRAVAFESRMAA